MAKRITSGSINWQDLSKRVPQHQRALFNSFRTKYELYLRKCLSYPLDPPKIDWNYYKTRIFAPGMVETFQKEYEALKIPYPPENVSSIVDAYEKEVKSNIETFKKESDIRIKECQDELNHIASLIPYDQMTMDDFKDTFPEEALDTFKNPTFWPHLPEDQIGYVAPLTSEEIFEKEQLEKVEATIKKMREEKKLTQKSKSDDEFDDWSI